MTRPTSWPLIVAVGMALATACTSSEAKPNEAAAARTSGYVDSAMTIEEGLRRFRESLPVVTGLSEGAESRDGLIRRFVASLERGDTAALRAMVLSRAEFAYVYYPSSPYTRHPTKQVAGLAWFLLDLNSVKGMDRALARYGGRPLGYRGHRCEEIPRSAGGLRFWDHCALVIHEGNQVIQRRFFGSILERDGTFKFLSYGNDF